MPEPLRHATAFEAIDSFSTPANRVLLLHQEIDANLDNLRDALGEAGAQRVLELMRRGQISGSYKEFNLLPGPQGTEWVLLMGLGPAKGLVRDYRRDDKVRSLLAIAARHFRKKQILSFAVDDLCWLGLSPWRAGELVAEGVLLGGYRFDGYRSERSPQTDVVQVLTSHAVAVQRGLDLGAVRARAALLARDLVNTPSSDLKPMDFAAHARALAERHDTLEVEVMGRAELEQEGMGLHLAVARGSEAEPCVVVLRYQPDEGRGSDRTDLVMVGKGVTFDSGGYDIKGSAGMRRMYRDMAGAAAVLGAMAAIAGSGSKRKVAAVIPLAENMISGEAFRPGDILTSRMGLTVEIANTDAEGRLLLADSLHYASERFAPRTLVDIATLTGAIRSALGLFVTGLFTHAEDSDDDDTLVHHFMEAGRDSGEWVWRLPVAEDYRVQLGSNVADVANCSTDAKAGAGAITAALFLKQFVDFEQVESWAHLDIAATAFMERTVLYNKVPYWPREGATAVGVRLLAELVERL